MGMNLPKWSIILMLFAFSVFAMAGGNGVNAYMEGWSETHPTDGDVFWGVSGPFDFDGDAYDEIIAYSDDGGITLQMYEATADNEWANVWTYTIADVVWSRDLADQTGDLDRNGYPEFYVCGKGDLTYNSIFVFELDSLSEDLNFNLVSEFDPEELAGLVSESGTDVKTVQAHDLDADGVTELLLSDGGGTDFVAVISLDTLSTFEFPNWIVEFTDQSFCCSVYGAEVGDFDNNGTNNFAMVEWDYNGIAFFDVLGEDDYELIQFTDDVTAYDGGSLRSMESADVDGDGYDEIYVASTAGNVLLYSIGGDLADFDKTTDVYTIFDGSADGWAFNGAHMGNTDIWHGSADGLDYIITSDSSGILDLEYNGSGLVTDPASWDAYVIPTDVATWQDATTGDFDFDGLDEFLVVTTEAPLVQVFEHDGWNYVADVDTRPVVADTSAVDPVTPGFQTRGVHAGSDLDQDGLQEIIITDYTVAGVHIYEVVSDNTIEWVNTLSTEETSYWASPRHAFTGDLDGNGVGEVIYMSMRDAAEEGNGISVWEWDGVVGSDNYTNYVVPIMIADGTELDRYYGDRTLNIGDPDGDGQTEVLISNNGNTGATYDIHMIAHVEGTFASGFYSLVSEFETNKDAPEWGGSPGYGQPNVTDLDNDGDGEVCFFSWNNNTVMVVETVGEDEYEIQSATMIDTAGNDAVVYGTTVVSDIDGDGVEEIYGGMLYGSWIWKVNAVSDVADITFDDVTVVSDFGAAWDVTSGDGDGDGVDELYSVDYNHARVYEWDWNGLTWDMSVVSNFSSIMGGFAVDFADDLDGDGYPEVVQGFLIPPFEPYGPPYYEDNPLGYTFAVNELGSTVGVDDEWTIITPADYKLSQNYPNPFNPNTTIEFTLPLAKDNVNVIVYNMLGQEVVRLANNASYSAGTHNVTWNSMTADGTPAAAGLYIYELRTGNVSITEKMTLIK